MAVNATISTERKVAKGYSLCDFLENLYLSYKENYVSKCGDKEKSSYYELFYDLMVNKIVNYMNAVFTMQKIDNSETKFSSQDFFSKMGPVIVSFLTNSCQYNGVVFLDSKKSIANFVVENSIIKKTNHLEEVNSITKMHGLQNVEDYYNGMHIVSAYYALKASGVAIGQNDLQKIVEEIENSDSLTKEFINAVCIKLLLKGSSYALTRAEIFAEAFGATIDFTKLKPEQLMRLKHQKR